MLRTNSVSPRLISITRRLMEMDSLRNFRLVGETSLALQLGHRESIDIDLFSSNYFPHEKICEELTEKFTLTEKIFARGGILISLKIDDVKVDIVNDRSKK